MEYARPLLLFLVGVVVASAFFVLRLDHRLPYWARFWAEEPIRLAIVPAAGGDQAGCPANYAIDNRTDQPVLLSLADLGYVPPPYDDGRGWGGGDRDRYRAWPHPAAYDSGDVSGSTEPSTPDSAEPGVNAPADDNADPASSNYGGSLSEFGNDDPSGDGSADESYGAPAYPADDRGGFDARRSDDRAQRSPDVLAGNGGYAPPAQGQPIPLTPDSPSYGSPPAGYGAPPPNYGPPSSAYGPPSSYGPPAAGGDSTPVSRVKPGEIFFAASANVPPECQGNGNTVTLQFTE